MHNRVLLAIYLVTFALGVGVVIWLGRAANDYSKATPVIAALLVSIGWMVTTLITNRNNQRGHTIETITSSKDDNAKSWKTIRGILPGDAPLPLPDEPPLNLHEDDSFYKETVDRLLNDFDFISLGVFKGVYDRHMLYSALANDFISLYQMCKRYIRYVQTRDEDDQVWQEFVKLALLWGADNPASPRLPSQFKRSLRMTLRLGFAYVGAIRKNVADYWNAPGP